MSPTLGVLPGHLGFCRYLPVTSADRGSLMHAGERFAHAPGALVPQRSSRKRRCAILTLVSFK
jgi:hypothetical protein